MRRTFEQFLAVFNSLAPSQRITFAAIAVLIPVGFLFFAWNGSSSSMVALSYGKVFSLDEMRNAEQALKEAGLTKFRSEGRQILAPATDVEKYNAALLQIGQPPVALGRRAREETREHQSLHDVRPRTCGRRAKPCWASTCVRMILGSPDFEDADVLWTPLSTSRSRFSKDDEHEGDDRRQTEGRPRELTTRQIQALARRRHLRDSRPQADRRHRLRPAERGIVHRRFRQRPAQRQRRWPCCGNRRNCTRRGSRTPCRTSRPTSWSPSTSRSIRCSGRSRRRSNTTRRRASNSSRPNRKRTERFKQQPVQAEPGSKSNQPRALASSPRQRAGPHASG